LFYDAQPYKSCCVKIVRFAINSGGMTVQATGTIELQ